MVRKIRHWGRHLLNESMKKEREKKKRKKPVQKNGTTMFSELKTKRFQIMK